MTACCNRSKAAPEVCLPRCSGASYGTLHLVRRAAAKEAVIAAHQNTKSILPRVIKWLWLDAVLWSLLALYLGEVVPQEFGVAKKCWFPITELRAWLRRKAPEAAPDDYEALDGGEASEGAVEFAGLAKTFGSFKAVDGAALRLNHGECTC